MTINNFLFVVFRKSVFNLGLIFIYNVFIVLSGKMNFSVKFFTVRLFCVHAAFLPCQPDHARGGE